MDPRHLHIADYSYDLPQERIAAYPLEQRDHSKLLVWNNGIPSVDIYKNLKDYLPDDSIIIFNNTKVIPARILFKKDSGGIIEVFCLKPFESFEYDVAMSSTDRIKWICMIGGISKWKENWIEKKILISDTEVLLKAQIIGKSDEVYIIEFCWEGRFTFREIIESAGDVPLPPYIKRKISHQDKERYQTIFAKEEGSVAAPTAGLHFTDDIIRSLSNKNIYVDHITLHVGAGTFKPVKSTEMKDHEMHSEWIEVSMNTLELLLNNSEKQVTVVGTTSARTIESLYWMGVKIYLTPDIESNELAIKQWEVYDSKLSEAGLSVESALDHLLQWMNKRKLNRIFIPTQIIIAPGYQFKIAKILITNFHQPQSTLLLLIAAAIGEAWKDMYEYALKENFRFLSYGDGCLLHINNS